MRKANLGLSALLLLASCEDACWMNKYDFARPGENVDLYAYGYTEADLCGGSITELDTHAGMVKDDLGIAADRTVMRWISPDVWAAAQPCELGSACTQFGEAFSTELPNMHEVVHTLTASIGSDGCPLLIDEGLASYYDSADLRMVVPTTWWDELGMSLRDAMEIGFEWSGRYYIHANRLVSLLMENYGPEAIVQLCETLPIEPRLESWDQATRDVLGISLEQLIAEYEAYPECTFQQMRARLWGCRGPADFTFPEDGGEHVVESGCGDPQATNSGNGSDGAMLLRRVYLPRVMEVNIDTRSLGSSGTPATYMISECLPCSEDPTVFVEGDPRGPLGLLVRPGMHEVAVFFDKRDQVRLTIEADPLF